MNSVESVIIERLVGPYKNSDPVGRTRTNFLQIHWSHQSIYRRALTLELTHYRTGVSNFDAFDISLGCALNLSQNEPQCQT